MVEQVKPEEQTQRKKCLGGVTLAYSALQFNKDDGWKFVEGSEIASEFSNVYMRVGNVCGRNGSWLNARQFKRSVPDS